MTQYPSPDAVSEAPCADGGRTTAASGGEGGRESSVAQRTTTADSEAPPPIPCANHSKTTVAVAAPALGAPKRRDELADGGPDAVADRVGQRHRHTSSDSYQRVTERDEVLPGVTVAATAHGLSAAEAIVALLGDPDAERASSRAPSPPKPCPPLSNRVS